MKANQSIGRIQTRDFHLEGWQQEAVRAWTQGDGDHSHKGTLEIFTGGGKTLIALECAVKASHFVPDLRIAIVVPTEALAHQWRQSVTRFTNVAADDVGILGAGQSDSFASKRILIAVLNTAYKKLPSMAASAQPLMLVVDECHRAGSSEYQRVLDTPAQFRLGLSATPEREEFDESGLPLRYDEHVLGRKLGRVVFEFDLKKAREVGWLPDYKILHHGITLAEDEQREYDSLSKRIEDVTGELKDLGINRGQIQAAAGRKDNVGQVASLWKQLTAQRKDLLFRARERTRITVLLLQDALRWKPDARILLFNERVNEAAIVTENVKQALPNVRIGLEHSKLPDKHRLVVLDQFRTGEIQVLTSVKALIEGLDVPAIDVAISVASTSSVRQRIQSLGRALRKRFGTLNDDSRRVYILYVANTVDEEIYAREDWSDLTGDEANDYFRWELGADSPNLLESPPRRPLATEEQEWRRLNGRAPDEPESWGGAWPAAEFSVDTQGTVTTSEGVPVANPQGVSRMVEKVRGRPGGRFFVTPKYRMVLVTGAGEDRDQLFVAGVLNESFRPLEQGSAEAVDIARLRPGDAYPGPRDSSKGEYRLSQKAGGLIERRKSKKLRQYALLDGSQDPAQLENARRVLSAWNDVDRETFRFSLNSLWHAWYMVQGEPRFLAVIEGGFAWPSDQEEEE